MTSAPTYRLESVVKAKSDVMEDFVGPLDVILLLLSKNKIEIKDIKIADILDQYLQYLEQMKRMDLEIASEFITMASHLVYLKSKTLLAVGDDEPDSEMEQFIKSLEERQNQESYAKVKVLSEQLRPKYESSKNLLPHEPEPLTPDNTYKYSHNAQDLIDALKSIVLRTEQKLPPPVSEFEGVVGREPFSVDEKMSDIIRRLLNNGIMRLSTLFRSSRSRSELVATFLSVLELCSKGRINLAGADDDCTISYKADEGGEIVN